MSEPRKWTGDERVAGRMDRWTDGRGSMVAEWTDT